MQLPKKNQQNEDPPNGDKPKSYAPPAWPQPVGIFTNGRIFHPYVFLEKINEMYERIIVDRDSGAEIVLEHVAFASLLTRRTVVEEEDGAVLFKLFDIVNEPSIPEELVVVKNNNQYLRIDCLQDSEQSH